MAMYSLILVGFIESLSERDSVGKSSVGTRDDCDSAVIGYRGLDD